MNVGFYSYLTAAVAYGFFTLLLVFSWRQSRQARLLVVVMAASAFWALLAAELTRGNTSVVNWQAYHVFEVLRYVLWYIFLLRLFMPVVEASSSSNSLARRVLRWSLPLSVGFACLVLASEFLLPGINHPLSITGHVFMALGGLVILEQIYRNSSVRHRWAIKYLIVGAGCLFAFDFYLYADGLLFRRLEPPLWQARGFIHFAAIPLLAISAARSKNWSLNLFVSRDIVLNSAAILGGGLYLMAMAMAGYYLREFGGGWGKLLQVTLFALALVFLVLVLLSGQLRAKVRVFLGKHFYKNKYDYRIEWLRLTDELNSNPLHENQYKSIIQSMAQIIDARAGMLWLSGETEGEAEKFRNVASWHSEQVDAPESTSSSLVQFLETTGFVINLRDMSSRPAEYDGLELPPWVEPVKEPWIIVPLFDATRLFGFILLAQPLVERSINWEDRDLLKTAARQVANHLKILMTSAALAEAKQFEVFTRLSAYMVHDLKNIAAELELVAINGKKYSDNPAFIEDAFETVEHASSDIKRLLEQLRNRKTRMEKKTQVDLPALIGEVVAARQADLPRPVFDADVEHCPIAAEHGQLRNVLAHLVENAQQATEDTGEVRISLRQENAQAIVSIKDSGHGMDAAFIRDRLFKPFDTTKGNAGMGIGMYESRDFARSLGGDIQVQSKPGKGSIISLHLPVMRPPLASTDDVHNN